MAGALAGDGLVRSASSMSWRSISIKDMWNEQPDVFQRSRAAEEEEELRWAAIERLPTYDRLRKGILRKVLSNGRVEHGEVDITELKTEDKKQLMDSLLNIVEEDNEKFLKRLRERTDRLVSLLVCNVLNLGFWMVRQ